MVEMTATLRPDEATVIEYYEWLTAWGDTVFRAVLLWSMCVTGSLSWPLGIYLIINTVLWVRRHFWCWDYEAWRGYHARFVTACATGRPIWPRDAWECYTTRRPVTAS